MLVIFMSFVAPVSVEIKETVINYFTSVSHALNVVCLLFLCQ